MKQISKKTALLLAVLMAASTALVSCNGNNNSSSSSGSSSNTGSSSASSDTGTGGESDAPESATIGIMINSFGVQANETPVGQAWEEMMRKETGCDITFDWRYIPHAEYSEKLNIALASQDFPDIVASSDSALTPYLDQDIVVELSGYTDQMPNYMAFVDSVQYGREKAFDAEGKMWGFRSGEIPRLTQGVGVYTVCAYRYDVFEEHNIKIPETTDEFYDAAKKLKELYPDTYPVNRNWATFETNTYHTSDDIFWNGDAYEYGPVTENYKDMLTFLNKLYSEGLLDPECFNMDNDTFNKKMLTGGTFMQMGYWFNDNEAINNNAESDAFWVNAMYPSDPKYGDAWQGIDNVNDPKLFSDYLSISSESKVDLGLLIKLCDLQYRSDVIELITWGIEGESFVRDANGNPTFVDEIKNAEDPWTAGNKWGQRASAGSRPGLQRVADTKAYVDFAANDAGYINGELVETRWELAFPDISWPDSDIIPPSLFAPPITWTTDESQENSTIMTAVKTMVDEYKIKFIKGEESLDNWDSYVQSVEAMGYQEVVDRYNEKAAAIVK